ncbi:MAG: hypothetical protein ACI8Z1_004043 [Candidatus Azotimanducaceae bacterium]
MGDQCELTLTAIDHPDMGILYCVVCGWHFHSDCLEWRLEWRLDGVSFDTDDEMGKSTAKIYAYYYD